MPGARVCPRCENRWPLANEYLKCPLCDVQTDYKSTGSCMPPHEVLTVLSALRHAREELMHAEQEAVRRGPRWSMVDVLLESPCEVAEP